MIYYQKMSPVEAVSRNQCWTEGALESVNTVLTKDWIKKECF